MSENKLIGLSLSECVAQIYRGLIPLYKIRKIITETRCKNRVAWKKLINRYKNSVWCDFADEAEKIVTLLRKDGRIEQPRLKADRHFPVPDLDKEIYWVKSESEILWSDSRKRVESFREKFNEIIRDGDVMLKIFEKTGVLTLIPLRLYNIEFTYSGRIKGHWIKYPNDRNGIVDIDIAEVDEMEAGNIDGV